VVDDTFADMARHAMLLLVGRGMTIPPEHRRKPRRSEEPNIVVMVISGGYYLLSSQGAALAEYNNYVETYVES
jgi:hypothetical protein